LGFIKCFWGLSKNSGCFLPTTYTGKHVSAKWNDWFFFDLFLFIFIFLFILFIFIYTRRTWITGVHDQKKNIIRKHILLFFFFLYGVHCVSSSNSRPLMISIKWFVRMVTCWTFSLFYSFWRRQNPPESLELKKKKKKYVIFFFFFFFFFAVL